MPAKLETLEKRLEKAKLSLEKIQAVILQLNVDIKVAKAQNKSPNATKPTVPKKTAAESDVKAILKKFVKKLNTCKYPYEIIEEIDDMHILTVGELRKMTSNNSARVSLVDYDLEKQKLYIVGTSEYNSIIEDLINRHKKENSDEFVYLPNHFFKITPEFIKVLKTDFECKKRN